MLEYVFSEEIYNSVYGKPKGKDIWYFGDRNQTVLVSVGTKEKPIKYSVAKKEAIAELTKLQYPLYKTVYLHAEARITE